MRAEPLEADTVRVRWLATEPDGHVHMGRWRALLDADELARADKFLFAPDRDTFTLAHALTRAMLSGATGQPVDTWHYLKGEYGKPALAADCARCGLRFNISHTRGFAVCAIARDEIGVDVEASDRPIDFRIAARYFAPEEVAVVEGAPAEQKAAVFFRFWTLKEAFIKATGEGLRRPLASFSFAFDPLRISFHPERDDRPRRDDPTAWQFIECQAAPNRPLALAVKPAGSRPLRLDARAARAEEIGRREALR